MVPVALSLISSGTFVGAAPPAAEGEAGLVFNGFWIIIATANFLFFLVLIQLFAFGPISRMLSQRRERIEQGLKDAEQARRERETAAQEHLEAINDARREAGEILARAQKTSAELREADMAATRDELARLRERAAADIESEKQKAISELHDEVAALAMAATARVLKEGISPDVQRQVIADFLAENAGGSRN
jgi:F-type H+-transporting ATPase subunit b